MLIRFQALILASLFLLCSVARAADYFPPPDSAGGWRELKDAELIRTVGGMDLKRLEQAAENCQHGTQHGGLLVVRHGYLVFEKYWGRAFRDANPDMASTGKAFTSIACGIMLKEKHDAIPDGLNTKVFTEKYLPEAFPLDDPRKADITLGQLLCMSAGYHGEGTSPGVINNTEVVQLKPVPGQDLKDLDMSSIRTPLWTNPGAGYSYSSPAPHIASIVLRHVTGMELKDYINERLAKPMGWGAWNYCLYRGAITLPHANGAGSTALHATDALRFGYCLLHKGEWNGQQLVPAEYVELCGKPSPFNPHSPYSLQFEVNADGHVELAPRDAFWKSGAGGFALYVVPSLDMVIYKMGGTDGFYKQELTGIPQNFKYDGSRDNWKPFPGTPFIPGNGGGINRILELVSGAVDPNDSASRVDLPLPRADGPRKIVWTGSLTIDTSGNVYVLSRRLDAGDVQKNLPPLLSGHENDMLTIHGAKLTFDTLMKVVAIVRQAGVTRIRLAIEDLKEK